MKPSKVIALGLSAIMALSLAAFGGALADTSGVQLPNPFTDHETLAEAEQEAGFDFTVPDAIKGFDNRVYRASKEGGMVEVIFQNGDEEIRFRKAVGDEDISGNYTPFSEQESVDVDGIPVTMKGEDGKVNLAIWHGDGYAYAIDCTTAVDKAAMTGYIRVVSAAEPEPLGGDPAAWGSALEESADDPLAPPSPFIDCDSMAEAAELAGFDMALPNTPTLIQAWEGTMIQAFYGEDGNDMLIRKAVGSEDVSGDYNAYAQVETVNGVTLKGENDAFSLAIWVKDGYTYSVSTGGALSQAVMMALVAEVA